MNAWQAARKEGGIPHAITSFPSAPARLYGVYGNARRGATVPTTGAAKRLTVRKPESLNGSRL